jgi:hypothetical protein
MIEDENLVFTGVLSFRVAHHYPSTIFDILAALFRFFWFRLWFLAKWIGLL